MRGVGAANFATEVTPPAVFKALSGACTGSTPAFSEYDNMAGGMSKAELKSETGGISAKSCWEIAEGKEEIAFTPSRALEIMEP